MDSTWKTIFKPFLYLIGPAAVMVAGIMGAGSTVSLLSSGCWFGYSLLWAVFLSLPVIVVCQDTASRIGAVSGERGMMQLIGDETHRGLTWIIVIPVLFTCVSVNMGQLGAMAAGLGNLVNVFAGREAVPSTPSTLANIFLIFPPAILAWWITTRGGYKRIEKMLTALLLVVLVSFFIVAVQAFFHLEEIKQMFTGLAPHIPKDVPLPGGGQRSGLISFTSIIGGGVAATAILSFPYFTSEGGYNMENIRARFKKHLLLFGLIFGVYSCILMIAGAFALHPMPGSAGFNNATQMGMALKRALGSYGTLFFSIGLFICGFNTLTVVSQLGSYFILDCLGKRWQFTKDNKAFLVPFSIFIFLPAIMSVFWRFPNLLKVVISMVFNCLVSPLAIILIIYLINKKRVAGELKASPGRNLFLIYSLLVTGFTSFMAVRGLWSQLTQILGL